MGNKKVVVFAIDTDVLVLLLQYILQPILANGCSEALD